MATWGSALPILTPNPNLNRGVSAPFCLTKSEIKITIAITIKKPHCLRGRFRVASPLAITGPIISAVSAPSKIVQISCCSTATPFTVDGRSQGYFFRTLPTSKTQAYATAAEMAQRGFKKTAIIYLNTDFGSDVLHFVKQSLQSFGDRVTA